MKVISSALSSFDDRCSIVWVQDVYSLTSKLQTAHLKSCCVPAQDSTLIQGGGSWGPPDTPFWGNFDPLVFKPLTPLSLKKIPCTSIKILLTAMYGHKEKLASYGSQLVSCGTCNGLNGQREKWNPSIWLIIRIWCYIGSLQVSIEVKFMVVSGESIHIDHVGLGLQFSLKLADATQ